MCVCVCVHLLVQINNKLRSACLAWHFWRLHPVTAPKFWVLYRIWTPHTARTAFSASLSNMSGVDHAPLLVQIGRISSTEARTSPRPPQCDVTTFPTEFVRFVCRASFVLVRPESLSYVICAVCTTEFIWNDHVTEWQVMYSIKTRQVLFTETSPVCGCL